MYKYASSLGIVLLLLSAFFTWFWKPAVFYPQKAGKVINITEDVFSRYLAKSKQRINLDIYVFNIDGEKYSITKVGNENYNNLIGKTIMFRYVTFSSGREKSFREIICDGQFVYSINEYVDKFIRWLLLFIFSLSWCLWAVVKKWKEIPEKTSNLTDRNEEYFFDNWGVRKKNDNYTLSYISPFDKTVRRKRIEESDFIAAKNKMMTFEDFRTKYSLLL